MDNTMMINLLSRAAVLLLLFLLYRLIRHLMKTFQFTLRLPKLQRRRSRNRRSSFHGMKPAAKNKKLEKRYHRTPKDRGGWDDLDL